MNFPISIRECSNGFVVKAYVCLPDDEFVYKTLEEALEFIASRLGSYDWEYKVIKQAKQLEPTAHNKGE